MFPRPWARDYTDGIRGLAFLKEFSELADGPASAGPLNLRGIGSSFEAAKGEVLPGMKGGYVVLGDALYFFKAFQLPDQVVRAVLADGEAAAFFRSLVGEGADKGVPVGCYAAPGDGEISRDLYFGGQEVEGGAVMPEIVGGGGLKLGYVLFDPFDPVGAGA